MTKASRLRPKQTISYLEVQINDRNVSWVDKEATHFFLSPKLIMCWGLPTRRASKPINVRFAKGEPYKIKIMVKLLTL